MAVTTAVLFEIAFISAGGNDALVRSGNDGEIAATLLVRALKPDAPGLTGEFFTNGDDIPAEIEESMGGTRLHKLFSKLLADVALGNGAHIDVLALADLHEPLPVFFPDADLAVVDEFNSLFDRFVRGHLISAETDLPEVDERTDHGLKGAPGFIGNFERHSRHFRDFRRHRHGFPRTAVDFVEGRFLMNAHHVVIALYFRLHEFGIVLHGFRRFPKELRAHYRSHMKSRRVELVFRGLSFLRCSGRRRENAFRREGEADCRGSGQGNGELSKRCSVDKEKRMTKHGFPQSAAVLPESNKKGGWRFERSPL